MDTERHGAVADSKIVCCIVVVEESGLGADKSAGEGNTVGKRWARALGECWRDLGGHWGDPGGQRWTRRPRGVCRAGGGPVVCPWSREKSSAGQATAHHRSLDCRHFFLLCHYIHPLSSRYYSDPLTLQASSFRPAPHCNILFKYAPRRIAYDSSNSNFMSRTPHPTAKLWRS